MLNRDALINILHINGINETSSLSQLNTVLEAFKYSPEEKQKTVELLKNQGWFVSEGATSNLPVASTPVVDPIKQKSISVNPAISNIASTIKNSENLNKGNSKNKKIIYFISIIVLLIITGSGYFYMDKTGFLLNKKINNEKRIIEEGFSSMIVSSKSTVPTTGDVKSTNFLEEGIAFTFDYPSNLVAQSWIYTTEVNGVSLVDNTRQHNNIITIINNVFDNDRGETFSLDAISSNQKSEAVVKDILVGGERGVEVYSSSTNHTSIFTKHNNKGFVIGFSGRSDNEIIDSILSSFKFTEPFHVTSNDWYGMKSKSGFVFDVPKSIIIDGIEDDILEFSTDVDDEYEIIENIYIYRDKSQTPLVVFKLVDNTVLAQIKKDLNFDTFNHKKIVINNQSVDLYSNYDSYRTLIPMDKNTTLIAMYGYLLDKQDRTYMTALVNIAERIIHTVR